MNFKYGHNGLFARKVYAATHYCFELLPLATVVRDQVLVLHGGLFRDPTVSLDDIGAIQVRVFNEGLRGGGRAARGPSCAWIARWADACASVSGAADAPHPDLQGCRTALHRHSFRGSDVV